MSVGALSHRQPEMPAPVQPPGHVRGPAPPAARPGSLETEMLLLCSSIPEAVQTQCFHMLKC